MSLNIKTKEELSTVITEAFYNRDLETIKESIKETSNILDSDEVSEVLESVIHQLSPEAFNWWIDNLPEPVKESLNNQAQDIIKDALEDKGYKQDIDYSLSNDGGIIVSEEVQEVLLNCVESEEDREALRQQLTIQ